jgi:kumamolisin
MADRKVFTNSVTELPQAPGLTPHGLMLHAEAPPNKKEKMTLLFSVGIPDAAQADLEARVARGETVPAADLNKKYAADPAKTKALVAWLKTQGYKITEQAATGVYAEGTLDQIEKSLGVNMVRVSKDGLTFSAARNAPSLPADVGENVKAIIGLQPFRRAHRHFRMCLPKMGNRAALDAAGGPKARGGAKKTAKKGKAAKKAARAAAGPIPSPNIRNAPPYLVSEIKKAYNADGLSVTGKGQTIAILIDTVPADSDLKKFWRQNGISIKPSQIQKINVKGGPLPPPEGEETLDVSWSSGVAPDATIRIYATGTLQFVDLDRALDRIIADLPSQPGMRQLSISLGLGETFMAQDEVTTQHNKFLRLAAAGVNVFVSSGDAGSNPDGTGHSPTGPLQAEYESSDTSVIGVGGTSLVLAPNGQVQDEQGWAMGGGGKSVLFQRPPWQKGNGVPAGNDRLVPDVSLAADPANGAFLVLHGQPTQIGGTSWSAPVWAGFCALINEARQKAGKPPLGFLNPLMYPLQGTPCFRDIVSGSNGAFQAGSGYDMVTGLGVPDVEELIARLP